MNLSSYTQKAIQESCFVSLDLDFYCKFSITKVAEKFGIILKQSIEVVDEENFTPDSKKFYIVKSYGMGKERYRFYTDNLIYTKARIVMISAFGIIKEFGYTDDSCIVKFSVNFNKSISNIDLRNLEILKFVLGFNEDMIYRFFPNQRNSIYVKSIKNLLPSNKFYRSENSSTSSYDYILPNMKFYGVLFDDIKDGVVHFRYIGGEKYEYEITSALDVMGLCIDQLQDVYHQGDYTQKNKDELKKIIKGSDRILEAYENSTKFKEKYPKIKLTVDLDDNVQILKSKYVKFRDDIFDLLANSDITEGSINYDSALSKIQAKDMKGHIYELEGWEFINCELSLGYAEDCNFFECKINNSSLNRCNIYRYCTVKKSKIKDTYINRTCVADDSFIHGDISTIDGKINRGKIIGGRIGNHSIISPETEKLDYTKIYTK